MIRTPTTSRRPYRFTLDPGPYVLQAHFTPPANDVPGVRLRGRHGRMRPPRLRLWCANVPRKADAMTLNRDIVAAMPRGRQPFLLPTLLFALGGLVGVLSGASEGGVALLILAALTAGLGWWWRTHLGKR